MLRNIILSLPKHLLAVALLSAQLSLCSGQNFHPNVDDREYLDTIEHRLQEESTVAHNILVNQTKILQQVTRSFIESKIKINLFKAVRQRVEMELQEMTKTNATTPTPSNSTLPSSRQGRQDDDDDDDAVARVTIPPRPGLLPQLANVVSTLFGSDVNVTGYLKDATAFLPQDLSSRIISAASLIDPNRFTSTTVPTSQIVNGQLIAQSPLANGTTFSVQSTNFVQQRPANLAAAIPIPQSINPNSVNNNNFAAPHPVNNNFVSSQPVNNNFAVPQPVNVPGQVISEQLKQPDVSTFVPQPIVVGVRQQQPKQQQQQQFLNINGLAQQQQNFANSNGGVRHGLIAPAPLPQPGIVPQQSYNVIGPIGVSSQNSPVQLLSKPIPNFKVNEALIPSSQVPSATSPASSNEDEDYENNSSEKTPTDSKTPQPEKESSEDDLRLARALLASSAELADDINVPEEGLNIQADEPPGNQNLGYLDEYPVVKYAIKIFNHFTSRQTVPTTTEFVPSTTRNSSYDYFEEEIDPKEQAATQPSTYKQVVKGGAVLWQGAREAYNLLSQVNQYFDKINTRLENAGYGAEDVGLDFE